MSSNEKVLVIVVTYNGAKWLKHCLAPFAVDRNGVDVAVVDNGSEDETTTIIRNLYPFVHIFERPVNLGFGAANNIAMEFAVARDYKAVMLINQDASCDAATVRELSRRVDANRQIGIASPIHYSDHEYKTVETKFRNNCCLLGCLPQSSELQECDFINAALWYIPRKTLLEVGFFSPLFPHYGEDLDYSRRVKFHGLKIGYYPDLKACHFRDNSISVPDKEKRLYYAYHMAELINPKYSSGRRFWRGIGLTLGKVLKNRDCSYLRCAINLWKRREEVNLWLNRPKPDIPGITRSVERREYAPVLLLVYNRPQHTARVLEDFWKQPEAPYTPLYILSDGAKDKDDAFEVEQVRKTCRRNSGEKVYLRDRESNVGLARNVVEGVEWVLKKHNRVVVLEDDLHLSPYFLRWMNDSLEKYKNSEEIAHLHAGTFYTSRRVHNNHALSFIGSWGWATWRDRWQKLWEPDGKKLLAALEADPGLLKHFNYGGYMRFSRMLKQQIAGKNNSWAIRWHTSILLNRCISINSNPPLVSNMGFDGSGTHCSGDRRYRTAVSPYPLYAISSRPIPQKEEPYAREQLLRYYRLNNNKMIKGWYKVKDILYKWMLQKKVRKTGTSHS